MVSIIPRCSLFHGIVVLFLSLRVFISSIALLGSVVTVEQLVSVLCMPLDRILKETKRNGPFRLLAKLISTVQKPIRGMLFLFLAFMAMVLCSSHRDTWTNHFGNKDVWKFELFVSKAGNFHARTLDGRIHDVPDKETVEGLGLHVRDAVDATTSVQFAKGIKGEPLQTMRLQMKNGMVLTPIMYS